LPTPMISPDPPAAPGPFFSGLIATLLLLFGWYGVLFAANPAQDALSGLQAAHPTARISLNPSADGSRVNDIIKVDTSTAMLTPDQVWERMHDVDITGGYYEGFTQEFHWLAFTLDNSSESDIWLLEITNPHLNGVKMWIRSAETVHWQLTDSTGRNADFYSRRVSHYNYAMRLDLPLESSTDVVLMLDKRGSSISYPIRVWSISAFNRAQQKNYILYGVYFGVFAIILLVIASTYIFSQRIVFLWYFLYAASVAVFVFNDIGLAHQYLYPGSDSIGSLMRVGMTYLMVLSFNLFTISYFQTKTLFRKSHWILSGVCAGVMLHAGLYLIISSWFRTNITPLLFVLYAMVIISILTALVVAFLYVKRDRYPAYFFIAAFGFIFLASFVFLLGEFGVVDQFGYLFTPIQLGYAAEIIFLSGGLAWQVRSVEKSKIALNERIARLETENLRAFIDGTEEERNRVAMDLHDSIGNRLAQLKRSMEKERMNPLQQQHEISGIIAAVRQLSHRLTPPGVEFFSLEEQIQQLVEAARKDSKVTYEFQAVDVPDELPKDIRLQLSRIVQEGIQNIEKHSNATRAEIQLIGHPDELVLTLEDDGVGVQGEIPSGKGIGMENIRRRAVFMDALVAFTSQPGQGMQLMVTVPLKKQ